MFQQFENEISTILTTGVRNVAGAAEEIMNTAATIKSQEEKINALTKSKTSLQKVAVLESKLQKSQQKVKLYQTKLDSISNSKGDSDNNSKKIDKNYTVEVMEDTNLLVLSHTSEDIKETEESSVNSIISAEDSSEVEESSLDNKSVSPQDTEYDELNIIDSVESSEVHSVSELDLMWDKMTYSIEHSAKLLEEMEELKLSHRDETLALKTENSNPNYRGRRISCKNRKYG